MSNTFNMARLDFYTLKSQMTTYMVIIHLSAKGTNGVMKLICGFHSSNFPDILSL